MKERRNARAEHGAPAWDERRLAEGLAAGDRAAQREFFSRAHEAVFVLASRLAPSLDHARDWTHDVLLGVADDVARGRFTYRRPGAFWAWFRKRAYFRLLTALRTERLRVQRERAGGPGWDDERTASALIEVAGASDPHAELERAFVLRAFERCLDRLPNPDHRRALWLHLREDLPYDAVAAELGAPLNTLKAWIRRGRLSVRRCLAEALGYPAVPDVHPDDEAGS